ncbi:hypothetical protein [Exilibacterium tricleocarpae]|nr:hypothetical protein [Exilibacterium tricleocarpae]
MLALTVMPGLSLRPANLGLVIVTSLCKAIASISRTHNRLAEQHGQPRSFGIIFPTGAFDLIMQLILSRKVDSVNMHIAPFVLFFAKTQQLFVNVRLQQAVAILACQNMTKHRIYLELKKVKHSK